MAYTFISRQDKFYSRKVFFHNIQQCVGLFAGCMIVFPFVFEALTKVKDIYLSIILLFVTISLALFVQSVIVDVLSRTLTGVNMKSYEFFRQYKDVKKMLWNRSISLFYRSGRVVLVDRNFDGFKRELYYNFISAFMFFIFLLLASTAISLIPTIVIYD